MQMKKILFALLMAGMSLTTMAQTRIVKGAVIDKDGNPLPGVKVEATNGAESTVTDADGTFELEVSQWLKSITVTYPGMKSHKQNLANYNGSEDVVIVRMKSGLNGTFRAYGGIGFATFSDDRDDDYTPGSSYSYEQKNRFAGKLGFGYEMQLAPSWYLIPSIEAAWKGCNAESNTSSRNGEHYLSILYLQVPVLVAYQFDLTNNSSLLLKAGPYFSYGLSGREKDEIKYPDGFQHSDEWDLFNDDGMKRFDIGLSVGAEYGFQKYFVGVNYELGFSEVHKEVGFKNRALFLNLGIKF